MSLVAQVDMGCPERELMKCLYIYDAFYKFNPKCLLNCRNIAIIWKGLFARSKTGDIFTVYSGLIFTNEKVQKICLDKFSQIRDIRKCLAINFF